MPSPHSLHISVLILFVNDFMAALIQGSTDEPRDKSVHVNFVQPITSATVSVVQV